MQSTFQKYKHMAAGGHPPVHSQATKLSPGVLQARSLEAQQRYFSCRAILAAIVSQKHLVLVFMGYRTIIARYVAKWGAHRHACVKLSTKGGIAQFWGSDNFP